jgi:hypothetical protein
MSRKIGVFVEQVLFCAIALNPLRSEGWKFPVAREALRADVIYPVAEAAG